MTDAGAPADRPKLRPELDTKVDTRAREFAVSEFKLKTERKLNPHDIGMGPRKLVLPPPRHMTPSERHVAGYITATFVMQDRIDEPEDADELKEASASLHEAGADFLFGPSNVASAVAKSGMENARRSAASRDPEHGVLQRDGESMDTPKNVAMNRITRVGTCGDMATQTLYRHLSRIKPHMTLHLVDYLLGSHNWVEQTGGKNRLALDLWCFRVLQARHGLFCLDEAHSQKTEHYTSDDIPWMERRIARHADRFKPREFAFWQKVTKLRKENTPFRGIAQPSALNPFWAALVQDEMTHLSDSTRVKIKNHKARNNRKKFSEQKENIALERNNMILAVAAARTVRPDLSIRDAAREAPALVEEAKNGLLKPPEW